MAWRLIIVSLVSLVACSDDPVKESGTNNIAANNVSNSNNSTQVNNPPIGGDCPLDACETNGFLCGVHALECGEVDCGVCRFAFDSLGSADITSGRDGSIHLVHFEENTAYYSRVQDGERVPEVIGETDAGSAPSIAVDGVGNIHVTWSDSGTYHATNDGTWQINRISEFNGTSFVVIDADNKPHVVLRRQDENTRQWVIDHISGIGETLRSRAVPDVFPHIDPAVTHGSNGEVAMALSTGLATHFYDLISGEFVRDEDFEDTRLTSSLSVAFLAGEAYVLAKTGNRTLRTGSQLTLHHRSESGWESTEIVSGVEPAAAVAAGPNGLHLFYHLGESLTYTRPESTHQLRLRPRCGEGFVKVALDHQDQPHILTQCEWRPGDEPPTSPSYWRAVGRYTDQYITACENVTDYICDNACQCGTSDCCYQPEDQSGSSCSFGPGDAGRSICIEKTKAGLCGNHLAEEAPLFSCEAAIQGVDTCTMGFFVVPDPCWDLATNNF